MTMGENINLENTLTNLRQENDELRRMLKDSEGRISTEEIDQMIKPYHDQIIELQEKNMELEREISDLRA
jgi:cell division protein FtsB